MEGTPGSAHRRSHPARRRAGPAWLTAVPGDADTAGGRRGGDPATAGARDHPSEAAGRAGGGRGRGRRGDNAGAGGDRRAAADRASVADLRQTSLAPAPWSGPLGPVVAGLFGALTRARGARVFHPAGTGYRAQVTVAPAGRPLGAPFLDRPGSYDALVRMSRGAGIPDPFPDVLGLAIKVIDAHGPSRDQDLLVVSSGGPPMARHLLMPATGFLGRPFSSVLPYMVGRRIRLFGAMPRTAAVHDGGTALAEVHVAAARGELRFDLMIASEFGAWRPFGKLVVGEPLPDAETDGLRFSPWQTGPGITPLGILQALRHPAYRGSQGQRR